MVSYQMQINRKQLKSLVNQNQTDSEIGEVFGVTRNAIVYWRKKYRIKTRYGKGNHFAIKVAICSIINREPARACYTDEQIWIALVSKGFKISRPSTTRRRLELKIPPSRKLDESILTRQYLYWTQDRVVWSADLKHTFKSNGKSIWGGKR